MTAAHDIFLSYAREDAAAAEAVAAALAREGFSVWWDRRILAGQAFDQRIEGALDAARVVLVLWSPDSVGSEWVKNEAAAGLQAEKLVPAMLAPVTLPLEFRRRQTADLSDWQGEAAHPGWRSLCEALQARQGHRPGQPVLAGEATLRPPPSHLQGDVIAAARAGTSAPASGIPQAAPGGAGRRGPLLAGAAALLLALAAGVGWRVVGQAAPKGSHPPAAEQAPAAAQQTAPAQAQAAGPAALVEGRYAGAIVAGPQGSRSDVALVVRALDKRRVHVLAVDGGLPGFEVEVTRAGEQVISAGVGPTIFLDLARQPALLQLSVAAPEGTYAWAGQRAN